MTVKMFLGFFGEFLVCLKLKADSLWNLQLVYSLVKDILRAAKALGTELWKEMETERTYRDPGGAGQDENQEIGP